MFAEQPAFSVILDPMPDPDVYVTLMVKFVAVPLAKVQKTPGDADV